MIIMTMMMVSQESQSYRCKINPLCTEGVFSQTMNAQLLWYFILALFAKVSVLGFWPSKG